MNARPGRPPHWRELYDKRAKRITHQIETYLGRIALGDEHGLAISVDDYDFIDYCLDHHPHYFPDFRERADGIWFKSFKLKRGYGNAG